MTDGDGDSGLRFPFDMSTFSKVRLGSGVVGKTSYIAAFATIAVPAVAIALALAGWPTLAFSLCVLLLLLLGGYLWKVFDFASKNPGPALLENAELLQWKQLEMGAKDSSIILENTELVPNTPPPVLDNGGV